MTGTAGVTSQGGATQTGGGCQDDFERAFRNAQAGMGAGWLVSRQVGQPCAVTQPLLLKID